MNQPTDKLQQPIKDPIAALGFLASILDAEERPKLAAALRECATQLEALSSASSLSMEFGWVIERSDGTEGAPIYWYGGDSWGPLDSKAVRFCRHCDALEGSPRGVMFHIREHSWHVHAKN